MFSTNKRKSVAIALATAIGTGGPAAAQNWPLYNPSGEQVGTVYQETGWQNFGVWASNELQVRFYVEQVETEVKGGYWVGYGDVAERCEATAGDHLGQQLYVWGYLELRANPNDPNQAIFTLGNCNGPPNTTLSTFR